MTKVSLTKELEELGALLSTRDMLIEKERKDFDDTMNEMCASTHNQAIIDFKEALYDKIEDDLFFIEIEEIASTLFIRDDEGDLV